MYGAGDQVDSQWLCREVSDTNAQYSWPRTSTPTASKWSVWYQLIHIALNLDSHRHLPRPLGAWQHNMDMQNWWYVTSEDQWLWHNAAAGWQFQTKIPHCLHEARFHAHAQQSNVGLDLEQCCCVTMISSYQHILVQSKAPLTHPQRQ